MKKTLYILGCLLVFASCEYDNSELLLKNEFLAFANATANVAEGNGTVGNTVKLTITRATSDISTDLVVNFSVTSAKFATTNADASNTFTITGEGGTSSTVTIPKNKTTADILLTTKGNTALETNRLIDVTLSSASGSLNLGFPGPAGNGKTITVTIADDDCTPDIGQLLGAFDCDEPGYGIYTCNFSQISCTTIQNDNFWDDGGVKINYTLNPTAGTVSISEQTFRAGARSVSGSGGTINLVTGRMVVPYVVKNTATNAAVDTNTHTFTRK
jgi:hypothetical protein